MGRDFCFIGSEYPIQVGKKDFFSDLLLFNRALNCMVGIELKIDDFKPEYLGKLEFYLEAVQPFALCNELYRSEYTPQSILKYRRPPNVEDVREIYAGFFNDRTFLWGNLEHYFFKPQLAYSFYPTEGGHTYFVRRVLFFALIGGLVLWVVMMAVSQKRRRKAQKGK